MKKVKAYILFSGGLDSILAVKILQEQDIEIHAICMESSFFNSKVAQESARNLGINLEVVNIEKEMINLVNNPPHGYGKNMNPCIDCHGLMMRKAKELYIDNNEDEVFLATGEVLGQRPFSQNSKALKEVASVVGCDILRPLSAKLLPITEMEKIGIVDRNKLYDIRGRTRKRQMELVKKYDIKIYPSSGGGCILTDSEYSKKLRLLKSKWLDFTANDTEIIKYGRVFWILNKSDESYLKWILVVVGRNSDDCKKLIELVQKKDYLIELKKDFGPTTLVRRFDFENKEKFINNIKIPKKKNDIKLDNSFVSRDDIMTTILKLTGYYKKTARGLNKDFKIDLKL